MLEKDNGYDVEIVRGRSPLNDLIIDTLKPRIKGYYLDVGCNAGFLLSEVTGGIGVDISHSMIKKARQLGLSASVASALDLPFEENTFDTVVLSCTLTQIEDWEKALSEAIRVSRGSIIGIDNVPGKSMWGSVGGTKWIKSTVDPGILMLKYNANVESVGDFFYFFDIKKGAIKYI